MRTRSTTRRRLVLAGLAAPLAGAYARAFADDYPSKPIRTVVPWPAGGVSDVVTRRATSRMEPLLKQSIIIENRVGAQGQIGCQYVARATPDGYTLLRGDFVTHVLSPLFAAEPLYDPIMDFEPIATQGRSPMMLVVPPSLGINSLQELIALAKSRPGQLNYAGLTGATSYVIMERLKQRAGIDVRLVSYKGDAPMLTDLVAGHVQMMFAFNPIAVPFVTSGKLKALVVTGDKRAPAVPDVPTVFDLGMPDLEFFAWGAFFAPPRTPRAVIDKINGAVREVLTYPEFQELARNLGTELLPGSPEDLAALLKSDLEKWRPVIQATGVKL